MPARSLTPFDSILSNFVRSLAFPVLLHTGPFRKQRASDLHPRLTLLELEHVRSVSFFSTVRSVSKCVDRPIDTFLYAFAHTFVRFVEFSTRFVVAPSTGPALTAGLFGFYTLIVINVYFLLSACSKESKIYGKHLINIKFFRFNLNSSQVFPRPSRDLATNLRI